MRKYFAEETNNTHTNTHENGYNFYFGQVKNYLYILSESVISSQSLL